MALPTSSLALSQVNTALGQSSTAVITLNDPKVKSLAGTNGPSVSMSQLLGKSTAWFTAVTGAGNVSTNSTDGLYIYRALTVSGGSMSVQKLSLSGVPLAQTNISTSGTTYQPASMQVDSSGNIFVWGGLIDADWSSFVTKLNSNLEVQFNLRLSANTPPCDFRLHANGTFSLFYTVGTSGTGYMYTVTYSSTGVRLWSYRHSSFGFYRLPALASDSASNVYALTGSYNAYFDEISRGTIIKYNSAGTLLWNIAYDYASTAALGFSAIHANSAGDIATIALSGSGSNPIIRFNSAGTLLWSIRVNTNFIGTPYDNNWRDIFLDDSGFTYALGFQTAYISYYVNYTYAVIAKIAANGTLQWVRALRVTSDGLGPTSLAVKGNLVYVSMNGNNNDSYTASLPTDGSGVGTYTAGGITYEYLAPVSALTPSVALTAKTPVTLTAVSEASMVAKAYSTSTTVTSNTVAYI